MYKKQKMMSFTSSSSMLCTKKIRHTVEPYLFLMRAETNGTCGGCICLCHGLCMPVSAFACYIGFFGDDMPFWNWNIGAYSWISYIFTCVIQEFLARSMIYGSISKLFDGRNATIWAILLSSLLFGAVHIAHGFMYMAVAIILLGALGGLYEKQRSIWGVAVIQYVLGQAAACLGFLA